MMGSLPHPAHDHIYLWCDGHITWIEEVKNFLLSYFFHYQIKRAGRKLHDIWRKLREPKQFVLRHNMTYDKTLTSLSANKNYNINKHMIMEPDPRKSKDM